jgi:hypothetical protein
MPKAQPGHKSKPWDEDPEILRRLATVEDLVLAGYRNTEIGHAMSVSEATIRRDRERIAELWRRQATGDIAAMRERSVANLRRIQRLADNEFRNKRDQPANLRIQLEAEREIVKLQGTTAPVEVPISFKNPGDLQTLNTPDLTARAAALEALAQQLLAEEAGNEDAE